MKKNLKNLKANFKKLDDQKIYKINQKNFTGDNFKTNQKKISEDYKIKNLCLAGGVALNCVANGKILKKKNF